MSAIRTITERAKAIALQGHEVAMFSMGEPDFDTPAPIKDATCRKLDENRTHYTSNRGAPALRRAIAEKEERDCGIAYDPENEILLTNSGAEAINNALTAFIDPGAEVVVLTPAFVSYRNVAALCGGIVREAPLRAETGFQVDEAALEAAVTDRTRLLVLNNPSTPPARCWTRTASPPCAASRWGTTFWCSPTRSTTICSTPARPIPPSRRCPTCASAPS